MTESDLNPSQIAMLQQLACSAAGWLSLPAGPNRDALRKAGLIYGRPMKSGHRKKWYLTEAGAERAKAVP